MRRINLQTARDQIARPNTIRDINRQIVLSYVRDRAPISRAQIARETELHRSTVSLIIEELERDGLIVSTGEGESTGGRKPTLYRLMTGVPVAVGVDVGPAFTTVGIADLAGNTLDQTAFMTLPDVDEMTVKIIESVKSILAGRGTDGLEIGISVPGLVDQTTGKVLHVPYFDWRDWDVCKRLHQETGLPVTVENDANATALAELWLSADLIDKTDTFVAVLVGEGIGTGVVFDGRLYRGERGAGGEFGHMVVGRDAPVACSCGSRECWEAYASEKAMIARHKRILKANGTGTDVPAIDLIERALNGDIHAKQALDETVEYLGNGISSLIVGLSPQVVVVSGRITRAWELFEEQFERVSKRSALAGLPPTRLVPSSLGDNPTLTGAFCLVLARRFGLAI